MNVIQFLPEAKEDLSRLHKFISEHSQDAAQKAITQILDHIDLLADNADIGRPWEIDPSFRELIIRYGRRGYVARYRIHNDCIIIVRIWHMLEDR